MSGLYHQADQFAADYVWPDTVVAVLGAGIDGIVYSTSQATAVKVHSHHERFLAELAIYERLRFHKLQNVRGFPIPQLLGSSAEARIIEMSIVRPPFILDFAHSTLDRMPDFDAGVMDLWLDQRKEEFGDRLERCTRPLLRVEPAIRHLPPRP